MTDTATSPPAATEPVIAAAEQAANAPPVAPAQDAPEAPKSLIAEAQAAKSAEPATPAKYEFKLGDAALDAKQAKAFEDFAREAKLAPEAAQKGFAAASQIVEGHYRAALDAKNAAWREEAVHDKELAGADGKSLAQNLGIALKAAEELGGKELADALKASPFGSFPPLLRALYRAGSRMGDDNKIVDGRVATARTREEVLRERYAKSTGLN